MLYKTSGIILRSNNLKEYDKLITIYTLDFGKLQVKAKSVRKNNAKLKGALEPFLYSHLMLAPAKGFDIITGAQVIDGFVSLHQDLNKLVLAHYFAELLNSLITDPQKDDDIWNLVLNTFSDLDKDQNTKKIRNNFELKIADLLGYGRQPNFITFVQNLTNREINSHYLLRTLEKNF